MNAENREQLLLHENATVRMLLELACFVFDTVEKFCK